MRVIRHLRDYQEKEQVIVTIGNFDGIHLGHQKLIKNVVEKAKSQKSKSLIISFEPHPNIYFGKADDNSRIISLKNKIISLRNLGVDLLLILKFNQEISKISPESFLNDYILSYFDLKHLVIGSDFKFGYNREGNFSLLNDLANKYNFQLAQLSDEKIDNIKYSSSTIRDKIINAEMEELTSYLGSPYYITGRVTHGNMVARTLGYPTANIKLHNLCRPKYGVYSVKVHIDDMYYYGMANIGIRPTLDGVRELLEVNIFDYSDNLYDKEIKVELLKYIRAEIKFSDINSLKNQIKNDEITIRKMQK